MTISENIYRGDLTSLEIISPLSACAPLLDQARMDERMRHCILQSMLPIIFAYAKRLQTNSIDAMELVCVGNAVLVEEIGDALCAQENPLPYLLNRARWAMRAHIRHYGLGPISLPDGGPFDSHPPYIFFSVSLTDTDIFDIVEPPSCVQGEETTFDPRPLYAALDSLTTEKARSLICSVFGLRGQPCSTLLEIGGGGSDRQEYGTARSMLWAKLAAMRLYLVDHYPDFVARYGSANAAERERARATARIYEIGTIPQSIRRRLDEAAERLRIAGQPLTTRRLREESGCGTLYMSAYLYEQRIQEPTQPEWSPELLETYARLAAAGPVSLRLLMREAGIGSIRAQEFLQSIGQKRGRETMNEQMRDDANHRITAAIATLQAEGKPVTCKSVRLLSRASSKAVETAVRTWKVSC